MTASDRTRRHVIGLIGARGIAALCSAVIGIVVPRMLGAEEYGTYGIAIGIASMLVVISDLGLTTSLGRSIASHRITDELLWRVLMLRGLSGMVLAAAVSVAGLAIRFSGAGSDELGTMLLLAGGFTFTAGLVAVATGLLPALQSMRMLLAITVIQPALELALVAGVLSAGFGAGGVIVASTTAAAAVGTVGVGVVLSGVRRATTVHDSAMEEEYDADSVRTIVRYGQAMFLVALCYTAFGQIDQLMIYAFHGASAAGEYIAAWRLITLLHLPGFAVATVVAPRLAAGGPAATKAFHGWVGTVFLAYLGIVLVAMAVAPVAVPLALTDSFSDSVDIFLMLSVYAICLGMAPLITMAANYLGGARKRVKISAITLAVNLVLDLALVPPFGATGAAIATTVAFGWYVAAHGNLVKGFLGAPQNLSRRQLSKIGIRVLLGAVGAVLGTIASLLALTSIGVPEVAGIFIAGAIGFGLYALCVYPQARHFQHSFDAPADECEDEDVRGAA
jgi:O-antigen/teichoic acid export membrane protein